ncbi:LysR family transcriptional regulator [Novosphingobium olei]|uniref:LysR family transcriptional regulator n=1 Tax=Novosphingobium olei TaxID=2728851 RepID=A0A7Y0BL50_9SPHN|nr:LysR family transcriptional regulator [Novosphingobium olei]NML92203.1 LysR family transcriptional regulator [Novosphingobium olei]BEV01929.1 LysR family transcriptional regulator [Novosphingobium olei]
MRFGKLDLNLLVALDALLTEKSVSLAAYRLCLSQSATSSALGRLREYFGDDLLVVKGRQMTLTTRAEELIEPVRSVLEQIRTTVAVAPPFEPATADRQIRIMASDYSTEVLLTRAIAAIALEAPNIRFEIQPMHDAPIEALERGYIDLLLTIHFATSTDHPSRDIFEDTYVVVGWDGNPAMAQPMTRDAYFALGHVTARFGKLRVPAFEDWFMRRQKQQRRVEVVAPSFLSLPGLLINTNRIATMHRRMAEIVTQNGPLVMHDLPFDIPPIRETLQWHISNNNDALLRWVVEKLAQAADSKGAGPADGRGEAIDPLEIEYRMNRPRSA